MQNFSFHTGQHLILNTSPYVIKRILSDHQVVLERKSDLSLLQSTKSELIDAYTMGNLVFVANNEGSLEEKTTAQYQLFESFTEEQQNQALRKKAYVELAIKELGPAPSCAKLRFQIDRFAERLKDTNPPSAVTVYRWWKIWDETGGDVIALINRRSPRSSKYHRQYREILFEVIDEVLMHPEYGSKQDAFELFKWKIGELNDFRVTELPIPSRASFYRLLTQLIDPYELKKAQQGKRAADMEFRVSGKGVKTTRILERVEIDHTPIDLMVVDEVTGQTIGRPTFTAILDHFSRMPLGFYMGFEPPSGVSVMRAIRHAILPKTYIQDRFPDIKKPWPAHGIFWQLVCDNGSEFHDQQLKRIAHELNIELFFCPKQHPYYKGAVERFLGSLNDAVCHSAAGSTRSNIQKRGNYNSAEEATITLQKLNHFIHDWIINIYLNKFHEGLGDSPVKVWNQGLEQVEPTLPLSKELLDLTLTKEFDRSINHEGVSFSRLKYNSHELGLLRRSISENTKVKVRVDPENLGKVWVYDIHGKSFFPVPSIDPEYAEGLSLRQHEHILKGRQNTRKSLETNELLEDKVRFKKEIREASKAKSIRKKTKAAQLSQLPIVDVISEPKAKKQESIVSIDFDDLDGFDMDWGDQNG